MELSGSGDVILTQGETKSLTVETDDNIMQYVTTNVRGPFLLSTGMNDHNCPLFRPQLLFITGAEPEREIISRFRLD
ncbi:MAG: DUF2807 domain-containing protein [Caldilineaceae bacterium]